MPAQSLTERLEREKEHAFAIIEGGERNWNWHTPAGRIRHQRRLTFLSQVLPPDCIGTAQVIEVGAGTGTYSPGLAQAIPNLIATDLSPELLSHAHKRHPQVHFEPMDAHDLKCEDASLDAVIGCSILHHLDWKRALTNYFCKLRSGGRIRFCEPNLLNPQIFLQKSVPFLKRLAGDSPDEYAFTRFEITRVLRECGYQNIIVTPFEFLHPATPQAMLTMVIAVEKLVERTWINEIAGSLMIEAEKA